MWVAPVFILPSAESGESGSGGGVNIVDRNEWNCQATSREAGLVGHADTSMLCAKLLALRDRLLCIT